MGGHTPQSTINFKYLSSFFYGSLADSLIRALEQFPLARMTGSTQYKH
jgi:hypothetical protein